MLIYFKVRNYMSFKDESALDFRATSYKQHPDHIATSPMGNKLLKTIAIYGANASGKSNFISAMFFFEKYIFDQFIEKNNSDDSLDITDLSNSYNKNLEPFILNNSNDDVSEFEIIFEYNLNKYQYGFECSPDMVLSEWLFKNDQKVFERQHKIVTYGENFESILNMYDKIPEKRLYLSVLDYFLINEDRKLFLTDFVNYFKNEYDVYFELFFDSTIKKTLGNIRFNPKIFYDNKFRDKVEAYLKKIDVGIDRIEVKKIEDATDSKLPKYKLLTVHNVFDENDNIVGKKEFELYKESSGTLRFMSYIQDIIKIIDNGGVVIIDELSARLHPLLTKLIVDIFQSKDNTKAQLAFTTHDISLLNKDQFRRDEVVFVDKNSKQESKIYALSDLKVRDDATFNKDYINGKYGAIPIIKFGE